MKSTSSTPTEKPSKSDPADVSAGALFTLQLKTEESDKDEHARYASPPCYLADFFDEELSDHPSKS